MMSMSMSMSVSMKRAPPEFVRSRGRYRFRFARQSLVQALDGTQNCSGGQRSPHFGPLSFTAAKPTTPSLIAQI